MDTDKNLVNNGLGGHAAGHRRSDERFNLLEEVKLLGSDKTKLR
jgi:hypothetical protein